MNVRKQLRHIIDDLSHKKTKDNVVEFKKTFYFPKDIVKFADEKKKLAIEKLQEALDILDNVNEHITLRAKHVVSQELVYQKVFNVIENVIHKSDDLDFTSENWAETWLTIQVLDRND